MPPVLRRVARLAALLVCFLIGAAPVAAHAELVAATPADGARLGHAPMEAVLTFSDELDPDGSRFRVLAPDGSVAGTGSVDLDVADRNVLRGAIEANGNGTYAIEWTAVASDGHEESGALTFRVGSAALANTALAGQSPAPAIGWLLLAAAATLLVLRPRAR